jgi:hypothetical protein
MVCEEELIHVTRSHSFSVCIAFMRTILLCADLRNSVKGLLFLLAKFALPLLSK